MKRKTTERFFTKPFTCNDSRLTNRWTGFFEHPDGEFCFFQVVQVIEGLLCGKGFPAAC